MPIPKQSVHIDAALTDFALKYSQSEMFIADKIMPVRNVKKESDKYYTYQLKDIISVPMSTLRANGAPSNERHWDVSTSTYQCEEYSMSDVVTDRDRKNADAPLEPDQDTTKDLTEILLLDREVRVATLMFDTGTTFASYTAALTGGDRWDDYENSDPYGKVETGKKSIIQNALKFPNLMTMGYDVFIKLRHHPDILDRVKYTGGPSNPAFIGEPELAKAFGIDRVVVGTAVYNNANYGQTVTPAFIWGKYCGLYYVDPSPTKKTVTAGITFRSQKLLTEKWRVKERKGDKIEVSMIDDEVVPAAGAGYVYSTVVS